MDILVGVGSCVQQVRGGLYFSIFLYSLIMFKFNNEQVLLLL